MAGASQAAICSGSERRCYNARYNIGAKQPLPYAKTVLDQELAHMHFFSEFPNRRRVGRRTTRGQVTPAIEEYAGVIC